MGEFVLISLYYSLKTRPMTASTSPSHSGSLYSKHFILMSIANFFMTTCLGSFFLFPLYIKAYGGAESDIGILMGAITISSVLGRPWISQAVDRFGRKRSYFAGTITFIVLPFGYLFLEGNISETYVFLLILRILQGFGIALCFTSIFTLIADIVPQERLNEGIGMFGITGLVGIAMGPAISEPIIRFWGFDAYFVSTALIATVSLFMQIPVPETYSAGKQVDAGISFFGVLKRKKTLNSAILVLFFGFGMATQNSFVSPYAQELGLSNISVYFISYSFAAVLSRLFGSRIADRIGESRVIPWAIFLIAVGFLSLVLVSNAFLLILSGFVTGLGHGFLFPCLNALMIRNEPIYIRGKINGIFTGSIDLGLFIGAVGLGYVGEWFGYHPIFYVTFLVLISALFFFLLIVKKTD